MLYIIVLTFRFSACAVKVSVGLMADTDSSSLDL